MIKNLSFFIFIVIYFLSHKEEVFINALNVINMKDTTECSLRQITRRFPHLYEPFQLFGKAGLAYFHIKTSAPITSEDTEYKCVDEPFVCCFELKFLEVSSDPGIFHYMLLPAVVLTDEKKPKNEAKAAKNVYGNEEREEYEETSFYVLDKKGNWADENSWDILKYSREDVLIIDLNHALSLSDILLTILYHFVLINTVIISIFPIGIFIKSFILNFPLTFSIHDTFFMAAAETCEWCYYPRPFCFPCISCLHEDEEEPHSPHPLEKDLEGGMGEENLPIAKVIKTKKKSKIISF